MFRHFTSHFPLPSRTTPTASATPNRAISLLSNTSCTFIPHLEQPLLSCNSALQSDLDDCSLTRVSALVSIARSEFGCSSRRGGLTSYGGVAISRRSRTEVRMSTASQSGAGVDTGEVYVKEDVSPAQVIDFLNIISQLKVQKRTGWVIRDVENPESIADHMYRMAVMALVITDPSIDKDRCIKMALAHDIAEAIVGDITPHCGVAKAEKRQMEAAAMDKLEATLGNGQID
eukprot:TRINITY_DN2223_c0_g1_i1.p1 TRINITY_DN2223_c0_g1~~TRINITY_DN2223_c0_g1_i1.p1  ORF type:complete len:231 (+),score=18.64 TRINITY_DN2223_c0_g1_i1:517-1209(+)